MPASPQRLPTVLRPSRGARLVGTVLVLALIAAVVGVRAGATGVEGALIAALAIAVGLGSCVELWHGRIEVGADTVRVVTLWRDTTVPTADILAVRDRRPLLRGPVLVVTADASAAATWRPVLFPVFVGAGPAAAALGLPRFTSSRADGARLEALIAQHRRPRG